MGTQVSDIHGGTEHQPLWLFTAYNVFFLNPGICYFLQATHKSNIKKNKFL